MGYKVPKFESTGSYHAEWWSFRHSDPRREVSFVHSAALVDPDGAIVAKVNCCYCNRTWESYSGQTARTRLASKLRQDYGELLDDAAVASIVSELERQHDWPAYRSEPGTRIGYSLSMCCPM